MKNTCIRILSLSSILLVLLLVNSCTKVTTNPTVTVPVVVTTSIIINVTSTSAQSGGTITSVGNTIITTNGVCYSSTNQTPTIANSVTTDPVQGGNVEYPTFSSSITKLTPNTVYYLRAYATNSAGTGYGSIVTFTTASNLSAVTTVVTTFAGNGNAGYADGSGLSALFNNPQGLAVDNNNNIYVSDSFNNYIREISPAGTTSTLAGSRVIGYADGPAAAAAFYAPYGLVVDANGNTYAADFGNNVIRKITPAGIVSTYAGSGQAGYQNGSATSGQLKNSTDSLAIFNNPEGLAIDAAGNIYVADRGNNVIRKISPAGRVVTVAGTRTAGDVDATGEYASFNNPSGLAVDGQGNLYVSDQGNSAIRKITPAGVTTTIAGGPLQPTVINFPSALAIDKQGNLYITDEGGRILQYTQNNVLYLLAGTLNTSGFLNGSGSLALFNNPQAITVDANGVIYVADTGNNCIRKIVVTLVAN